MLEKKYDHKMVEEGKYENWLNHKYFESGDLSKNLMQLLFHHLMLQGNFIWVMLGILHYKILL